MLIGSKQERDLAWQTQVSVAICASFAPTVAASLHDDPDSLIGESVYDSEAVHEALTPRWPMASIPPGRWPRRQPSHSRQYPACWCYGLRGSPTATTRSPSSKTPATVEVKCPASGYPRTSCALGHGSPRARPPTGVRPRGSRNSRQSLRSSVVATSLPQLGWRRRAKYALGQEQCHHTPRFRDLTVLDGVEHGRQGPPLQRHASLSGVPMRGTRRQPCGQEQVRTRGRGRWQRVDDAQGPHDVGNQPRLLLQLPHSRNAGSLTIRPPAWQVQHTATLKIEIVLDEGHVLPAIDSDHSHTVYDRHVLVRTRAAIRPSLGVNRKSCRTSRICAVQQR